MRYVLFILFLIPVLSLFSQEEAIRKYFDSSWNPVDSVMSASFYRVVEQKNDSIFHVKDYYMSGKPYMEGCFKSASLNVQHGQFRYWYENGQLKEEGNFKNGNKIGPWKKFYENGAFRSERTYTGEQKIYSTVDKMPEFPGGQDSLISYLTHNIYYPEFAKDSKIEGTVYVGFIVETDGNVTGVKVIRGIGGGCDEEALKVINGMPSWTPGEKDGKPVKVQYVIPLSFRL